ncbi:MAG: nucleotidyltransferase domain-containing protein [Synergistaceae bacterium]|jgi:predicted nucleotidyltransferase|nr:nucleotidyltransferase domain-containing protein [Synergistaceae bacterium]
MSDKETVYTIAELKKRVAPIAVKYRLPSIYLFGSYARNEANGDSDVDMLIDRTGSNIKSLLDMGALYDDLSVILGKEIDLITTDALEHEDVKLRTPRMRDNLDKEKVRLYERQ